MARYANGGSSASRCAGSFVDVARCPGAPGSIVTGDRVADVIAYRPIATRSDTKSAEADELATERLADLRIDRRFDASTSRTTSGRGSAHAPKVKA
jgi:hypothetical protein